MNICKQNQAVYKICLRNQRLALNLGDLVHSVLAEQKKMRKRESLSIEDFLNVEIHGQTRDALKTTHAEIKRKLWMQCLFLAHGLQAQNKANEGTFFSSLLLCLKESKRFEDFKQTQSTFSTIYCQIESYSESYGSQQTTSHSAMLIHCSIYVATERVLQ